MAEAPTAPSALKSLWDEIAQVEALHGDWFDAHHVVPLAKRRVEGIAFFPVGSGLWSAPRTDDVLGA